MIRRTWWNILSYGCGRGMNLTMDITVKMPCECEHSHRGFVTMSVLPQLVGIDLGVDYIDVSGTSTDATKFMAMDAAHYELAPNQQEWLE
jgi:hypothetical protein